MSEQNYILDLPMCVYNHEKYIAQAIEGVVHQVTEFKFRLLIGDDCSTDRSKEIIQKYAALYPDKIAPFFHEKNLGVFENSKFLFNKCTSKYIALCDGDDYWVDLCKLQKQVDFLEKNDGFVACCSNAYERTGDIIQEIDLKREFIKFDDLAKGNCIYTCTAVYKNKFQVPDWFDQCKMGDWVIWLSLTQSGLIYNFKESMAVYRIHNNGIWIGNGREKNIKDIITTYNVFIREFEPEFRERLKQGAKQYYTDLLSLLADKPSAEIFSWTRKAFFKYYDIKQTRYLARYLKNILSAKTKTAAINKQPGI